MTPRIQKIRENYEELRNKLWPEITPDMIWQRKRSDGFSTIPRTLTLMMVMMDTLSKGRPVSTTYLELWCRRHDEAILVLHGKELDYATASGFSGERALNTWTGRMDTLEKLGFIKFAPGPGGKRAFAVILNPYHVLKRHKSNFDAMLWNSFEARVLEIRAKDLEEVPTETSVPEPAKPKASPSQTTTRAHSRAQ